LAFGDCERFVMIVSSRYVADTQDRFVNVGKLTVYELPSGRMCKELSGVETNEPSVALSADGKLLATGSVDQSVLLWDLTGQMAEGKWKAARLKAAELDGLWSELAIQGQRSYDAMWKLVAGAEDSVPFLRSRLKPAAVAGDAKRIQQWIVDLDSDKFAVRQTA